MKKYIAIATLLVAGSAFANAGTHYINEGRTTNPDGGEGDVYVVGGGQLFLNSWTGGSRTPTTFNFDVQLNGAGAANEGENKFTLRIHEQSTLAGTLTISATSNLISSGYENTISGNIVTSNADATLNVYGEIGGNGGDATLLKLTGSSIVLPKLNLLQGASVSFVSESISFNTIMGDGAVSFGDGSKINLALGQTLSISAATLTFGSTVVDGSTNLDSVVESFFTGASVASVVYTSDTKTLTVQAIPEPATFGLLAGLGALALVGTRRRRR